MLLTINSLKQKKSPIVIIIIMLSIGIYTTINLAINHLENSYYDYLKKQNVEYIAFDLKDPLDRNDVIIEKKESKIVFNKNHLIKIIPYEKVKINKPYLIKGNVPKNKNEITILPEYAKENKLKINDFYKINDKSYKIVGFMYDPSYIYPMIDITNPIFNPSKNNIVFIYKNDFNNIKGIDEDTYVLTFNNYVPHKFDLDNKISDNIIFTNNTVIRLMRISTLKLEILANRKFSKYFLYLLLSISVFIIIINLKKNINEDKKQIGILKSLGYNDLLISFSYLIYPFLSSLIGTILGYIIGLTLYYPLSLMYKKYYNLPLNNYKLDLTLVNESLLAIIIITILAYIFTFLTIRKNTLDLIKENNVKINFFSRLINRLKLPFEYRFKYNFLFKSLDKLIMVIITSFNVSLLMVLILISFNVFNNMIDTSFKGLKYNYLITLNRVDNMEKSLNEDLILNVNLKLKGIKKIDKKIKKVNEDISITGLDDDLNFLEILDENNYNINDYLIDEYGIIISKTLKEVLNVDIGDILIFENFEYKIVNISNEYLNMVGYVNRNNLSYNLNLNSYSYNQIASNKIKNIDNVKQVISLNDLKENLIIKVKQLQINTYIIVIFASILSFIIIISIAEIIIDENRLTIALMKVIGYENKKISQLIINIYTPFIVISYLLASLLMPYLLRKIIKVLTTTINMAIPIIFTKKMFLLGLIILLLIYYLAINLVKKKVNKIPLSIILKN